MEEIGGGWPGLAQLPGPPNLTTGVPSERCALASLLPFGTSQDSVGEFPGSANGGFWDHLPPPLSILLPTSVLSPRPQSSLLTSSHPTSTLLSDRPWDAVLTSSCSLPNSTGQPWHQKPNFSQSPGPPYAQKTVWDVGGQGAEGLS